MKLLAIIAGILAICLIFYFKNQEELFTDSPPMQTEPIGVTESTLAPTSSIVEPVTAQPTPSFPPPDEQVIETALTTGILGAEGEQLPTKPLGCPSRDLEDLTDLRELKNLRELKELRVLKELKHRQEKTEQILDKLVKNASKTPYAFDIERDQYYKSQPKCMQELHFQPLNLGYKNKFQN